MDPGMLALLGKTINMMEGFSFLWVVNTGLELDLWNVLNEGKTLSELLELKPDWDPVLLDHWLEQAYCLDLLSMSGKSYFTSKLGRAVETYRHQGLAAMYQEFTLYWAPYFAHLVPLLTRKEQKKNLSAELENELISRASLASEPFVWPVLKDRCKTLGWKNILDLGCGEGGYLIKLIEAFPTLNGTGVEMNQAVAKRAREQAKQFADRLQIICSDVMDCDEQQLGQFDACLLNNVIYYFNEEQRLKLLAKVKTLLNDGGQVAILCALRGSDYSLRMFRTHIPQNLMSFFLACHQGFSGLPTEGEIKGVLRSLGFEKIEMKPLMFNTSYFFFATNYR